MDPNDWTLTGNAGTNPNTNFLGTTDNEPLVIKTNGVEQLHIDVAGNVGIGQPTPRVKLDIIASGTYNNIEFTDHPFEISTGTSSSDYTLFMGADKANHLSYIQSANINIGKTTLALNPQGGNVGIGTASPSARLSVVASGAPEIIGTARSATLLSSADSLGASISSEQALASFGLLVDGENSVSLGVRAVRTSAGAGWPTTAIGLGMDVDNTIRAGASLFLHANGNVGIGTTTPSAKLTVHGDVSVTGDVILTGADCAEEFDIAEVAETEPGMVVVLDQGGTLHPCQQAYDKRVAGVISGAGDYQPGLILDRRQSQDNRLPVALVGKVFCKVDAEYTPIEVGDLLTTSPTPGHAMKADDPLKAFGAVIGKALKPLEGGQGLIPILIALQ